MKKWFNIAQWIALAAFAVAIAYWSLQPPPPRDNDPATWANWDGFMAISYAGVARNANSMYVSSRAFAEQCEKLREAGYRTITPAEALTFLRGKGPLPRKALLILFDGGRKETYIQGHPILRRLGMRATLCLSTIDTTRWDETYGKKGDIQKLAGMPQWNVACMGHRAVRPIVVDASGRRGHFLSSRRWLPAEGRSENDNELRSRIVADYIHAVDFFRDTVRVPVGAYVYPYADTGHGPDADPIAAAVNRQTVSAYFPMAFVSGAAPFNPAGQDLYRLTRLRVGGDWSAERLLLELERFQPKQDPVSGVGISTRWLAHGAARAERTGLTLGPASSATLLGSDFWRDVEISATLRSATGSVAVCYARFRGRESGVSITLDDGHARIRKADRGGAVTLRTAGLSRSNEVRLVWRIKNSRSWLTLDGRTVFESVPVGDDDLRPGRIGFECRQGQVTVADLRIAPIRRLAERGPAWTALTAASRSIRTDYLVVPAAPGREFAAEQIRQAIAAADDGADVWVLPPPPDSANPATVEAAAAAFADALKTNAVRHLVKGVVVDAKRADWAQALRGQGFSILWRARAAGALPSSAKRADHVWLDIADIQGATVAVNRLLRDRRPDGILVNEPAVTLLRPALGLVTESVSK